MIQLKKIWSIFTQNIITKISEIWIYNPGYEIQNLTRIRIQGSKNTGSRIRIHNTESYILEIFRAFVKTKFAKYDTTVYRFNLVNR